MNNYNSNSHGSKTTANLTNAQQLTNKLIGDSINSKVAQFEYGDK
jgi:hypothetical protein